MIIVVHRTLSGLQSPAKGADYPPLETLPKKSRTVEGFLRGQSESLIPGWGPYLPPLMGSVGVGLFFFCSPSPLVREGAIVDELCESYECG